jgi:hypothetical protein
MDPTISRSKTNRAWIKHALPGFGDTTNFSVMPFSMFNLHIRAFVDTICTTSVLSFDGVLC